MSPKRQRWLAAVWLPLCAASLASGARAMECTSENASVMIPKNVSVESISYMQMQDAPVRAILWSNRLGPRTVDNTQDTLPKGGWMPVAVQNPPQFGLNRDKSWKLGIDAMSSDSGEFNKAFDCVVQELHANGAYPYGYYVLSFIPKVSDPGKPGFLVKVQLHKGPLPPPPRPPKVAAAKPAAAAPLAKAKPAAPLAKTKAQAPLEPATDTTTSY
jgi:hypothetical protein